MKKSRALKLILLNVFAASSAFAQALYWDPSATGPTTGGSSGGNGNWDTTSSLWYDGISTDTTWVNGDNAYFTNTAGTITLATSLGAGNIYFTNVIGTNIIVNATGVETLTNANVIDTGGSEAIISVPVVNSSTLNKNGAGRLHLTVDNTGLITGTVNVNQGELSVETNGAIGGAAGNQPNSNPVFVADGAALEFNYGSSTNGFPGFTPEVTISGTGITNSGALRNVVGVNAMNGDIILGENNTMIYSGANSALVYQGSDPLTDNGNGYNLLIAGPGNFKIVGSSITLSGSLILESGANCQMYPNSGATYNGVVISNGATLNMQNDTSFGDVLPYTNVIIDGGTLNGNGSYAMNSARGITVTTNGGTLADTDTGGAWYTGNIISSNASVIFSSSGGTIRAAGSSTEPGTLPGTNVILLGTGAFIANGGNVALSYCTNTITFSNLLVNGCTFTFNYDSTSGQLSQLGSVPSAFSQSNIWLNGGQFHMGHSSSIQANRGIYVTSAGTTLNEVTSSGTATWGSVISGPGNITFATATHVLGANNTYTGNTTINSSTTLKVGNGGNAGTLGTGNTANSGTLTFNRTGSYTYGGVISGSGAVNNAVNGTITLTGKNTYTGLTTLTAGTLLVDNPTGSSGTGTGIVHVNSGGALGGTGTISGAVTVNTGGILSLLTNTLTINNSLTVTGNVTVVLNKLLTSSNGEAVVSGLLTNGASASLIITNSGPALAVGDKFQIFNGKVYGATMNITGPGTTGITWNNNLGVDGSISVATVPPPPKPVINSVQVINGNFVFSGTNGTSGNTYYVLSSTNLLTPLNQWSSTLTNTFPSNGQFFITNPIDPTSPQLFYLLQVQ